jgi:anti-sigma B factor antagonist
MNLSDVEIILEDGVVLALFTGEVDLSNARGIEDAILVATPNHATGVVLDLGPLDYLDSAGIGLLYGLREHLQVRGQTLTLVIPEGSPANDALRLAGVMTHLDTHETVGSALVAARGDGAGESDPPSAAEVPEVGNRVEE